MMMMMMATSPSTSPSISSSFPRLRSPLSKPQSYNLLSLIAPSRFPSPLRASRRFPNYQQEAAVVVPDPPAWIGDFDGEDGGNDEDDDGESDEEEDRSLDLLARFLHNVFRKISRRARKSVRSVLPPSISTKLVGFSVNGVLILAFLWILKAFLEVVCTVGSMVFVSILLVRGIWSGVSYIKQHQYYNYINRMDDDNNAWSGVQAAT